MERHPFQSPWYMIAPLTSLRFLFAFVVFLSHLQFLGTSDSEISRSLFKWFCNGAAGVSFFFVLSGFIMSYAYFERNFKTSNYFFNRIARIWPVHILTFIISIPLVYYYTGGLWDETTLPNLFLFQSWYPTKEFYFSYNSPSWSISTELFFYLIFPLFLFITRQCARQDRGFQITIYQLTILASLTFVAVYMFSSDPTTYHHRFYISPITRIADFAVGICLYHLVRLDYLKPIEGFLNIPLSLAFCAIFIGLGSYVPKVLTYSIYYWPPICMLIAAAFYSKEDSSILHHKTFVTLGEISFSFYLIHQLIIRYFTLICREISFLQPLTSMDLVSTFLVLVLSLGSSYLIFESFEKKLYNHFKRN